jgi:hypothetical protein
MAGLVPAIHVLSRRGGSQDVDPRHKAGDDDGKWMTVKGGRPIGKADGSGPYQLVSTAPLNFSSTNAFASGVW